MKIIINDILTDSVAKTLLIPLWCCASKSRLNPLAMYDPIAVEAIQQLDFDFVGIQRSFKEYGQVCCLAREKALDATVKSFFSQYPSGIVVNFGCGLSTVAYRTISERGKWYEIDFPEVIQVRKLLFSKTQNHYHITSDIFDPSWMEKIDFEPKRGILFLAAGVFHYHDASKIQKLFSNMAKKFTGGIVFFDAVSNIGMKISNRYVIKTGNQDALMTFAVNNPSKIAEFSPYIVSATCSPFFKEIQMEHLTLKTKINIAIASYFSMLKYITVKFNPALDDSYIDDMTYYCNTLQ